MIGDNLQQYTYDYLMQLALSFVPDDRDKRQGSVIYDALAPFCQVLAAGAMQLRGYYQRTYAITATGEDLDTRAMEQGITRYAATYAVKKISLADEDGNPITVPLGSRFSTVSNTNPVNYAITAQYVENGFPVAGSYEATCEEAGSVGNEYFGNLVNITFIQGIASAVMSTTLVAARDEETDDEMRERYFDALTQKPFGGNVSDYRTKLMSMPGVGGVQVYPTWNGGGTVKLSIIDATHSPCSDEFISSVQNTIDPQQDGSGMGTAPIGHRVSVVTPEEVTISVSASISFQKGYDAAHVKSSAEQALIDYMQSLRQSWADSNDSNEYSCDIFVARVLACLITVPGIANVSSVMLNGATNDIYLTQNGQLQQLPKLGEVVLNV